MPEPLVQQSAACDDLETVSDISPGLRPDADSLRSCWTSKITKIIFVQLCRHMPLIFVIHSIAPVVLSIIASLV